MAGCWTNAARAVVIAVGVTAMVMGMAAWTPARAAPASEPAGGTGNGRLDLVTGTDFAPFTGDTLPNGGLMTELVQRAFKAVGRSYDVRFMPWKRGYDAVVASRFLATFPYVRTPERERDVLFSDPVIEVRQFVYLSTHSRMEFNGPADFRGRVVCAPSGYALPPELEALSRRGELTRETPSNLVACVRMVAMGRADAFVLDEYTGSTAVIHAGVIDDIRIAEQPFSMVTQHLVIGRGTLDAASAMAAFNEGLKILKNSGVFEEAVARHTAVAPR